MSEGSSGFASDDTVGMPPIFKWVGGEMAWVTVSPDKRCLQAFCVGALDEREAHAVVEHDAMPRREPVVEGRHHVEPDLR